MRAEPAPVFSLAVAPANCMGVSEPARSATPFGAIASIGTGYYKLDS